MPFGHGQELYFWTLIVALLIFSGGGAVSVYEGILHVLSPAPIGDATWNYVVLGLAAVFEGSSLWVGLREFRSAYPDTPFWQAIRRSKDPTIFTVVLEDSAALAGLLFAFLGVFLSHLLAMPTLDGAGSIMIGLLLMITAVLLVRESKGLLTGEAADPGMLENIRSLVRSDQAVASVHNAITMHFGPDNILLAMALEFQEGLSASGVGSAIDRIEREIRSRHPQVASIFIEAQALGGRAARPATG